MFQELLGPHHTGFPCLLPLLGERKRALAKQSDDKISSGEVPEIILEKDLPGAWNVEKISCTCQGHAGFQTIVLRLYYAREKLPMRVSMISKWKNALRSPESHREYWHSSIEGRRGWKESSSMWSKRLKCSSTFQF